MGMMEQGAVTDAFFWSMDLYKDQISGQQQESEEAEDAWDEPGKPHCGQNADGVRVGIRSGQAELAMEKLV